MDRQVIMRSCAIICTLLAVAALVYLVSQNKAADSSDTESTANSNLTTNTNTMSEEQNSKLKIDIIKEGSGDGAKKGQTVAVDYTGKFTDGKVFDSSIPRNEPLVLTLGAGMVIQGWDLGIVGMKVGEERRLTIAPELAYGASGIGGVIPPNATLIFDVTMRSIK